MQLSKKAIDEFKKIALEELNITLTDQEANLQGMQSLRLIKSIYKPIPMNKRNRK